MKKYSLVLAVLAALAVLVGLVMATGNPQRTSDDVCRELKEVSFWIDQTAKHNHQLRLRKPELQNDFNSNGVTHSMISVYSYLYALKDKLGCR